LDIGSFVDYLQERGATPRQRATLQWRSAKHRIRHDLRDFKLTIRRDREKRQLRALADWQVERILPALSTSQRVYLAKVKRFGPD
jgi:hypothetical protein